VPITTTHREGVKTTARSRWVKGWAQHGACSKAEPDALFVRGAAQQAAKKICVRCPVVPECLADSLDNRTQFGSGAV
jgi:WhiB family transcriptional regulator, redox-sensing transcriptional regulator